MTLKPGTLFLVFIWSIFMGITAGSIGVGALVPSINLVAKPFVCPNGQMQMTSQDYHPSPIETVTTMTWYCVDTRTGTSQELSLFPMSLYAGTIYGFLLFLVILLVWVVLANRGQQGSPEQQPSTDGSGGMVSSRSRFENESARLLHLLETNQITKEQYLKKVADLARNS